MSKKRKDEEGNMQSAIFLTWNFCQPFHYLCYILLPSKIYLLFIYSPRSREAELIMLITIVRKFIIILSGKM